MGAGGGGRAEGGGGAAAEGHPGGGAGGVGEGLAPGGGGDGGGCSVDGGRGEVSEEASDCSLPTSSQRVVGCSQVCNGRALDRTTSDEALVDFQQLLCAVLFVMWANVRRGKSEDPLATQQKHRDDAAAQILLRATYH